MDLTWTDISNSEQSFPLYYSLTAYNSTGESNIAQATTPIDANALKGGGIEIPIPFEALVVQPPAK